MFKYVAAAVVAGLGLPAFAGGPAAPKVEPVIIAPRALADWTGGYAGATLGFGQLSAPGAASNSGATGGLHAGYNWDNGKWVFGAEATVAPGMGRSIAGREISWGLQARLRAGPKVGVDGRTWLFGSVGANHVNHKPVGGGASDGTTGYVVGLGVSHMLNDKWFLTGELQHSRSDLVRATGVSVGASYRF